METVESYVNTFDGTEPLHAHVAFDDSKKRMPMILFMHGLSGTMNDVLADVRQFAAKGVFAVAPDMRGRGDSAGKPDCGGMEILDIFMAIRHCLRKYPDRIDPDNISFWGYSGGGGNGFACAVRLPDLFNQIAIFFGISDYGRWCAVSATYAPIVEKWVGGTPQQFPWAYAARNVIPAAGNNSRSLMHLIWDEEEIACPAFLNTTYHEAARAAGCGNVTMHESRKSDARRFKHGYTTDNPDLSWFEETTLFPEIRKGGRSVALPDRRKLKVRGFVWTKRFALVIENASGTCDLEYDLSPDRCDLRVANLAAQSPGLAVLAFKSPGGALPEKVLLNGAEVAMEESGPDEKRGRVSLRCG